MTTRPHTTTAEFFVPARATHAPAIGCAADIETLYICEFCRTPVDDQTLESWEPCCGQFELACENRALRDLLFNLHGLTPEAPR